jgi:hypothetical protein
MVRDAKRAGEVIAGIRAMTKRSTVATDKLTRLRLRPDEMYSLMAWCCG